MYFTELTSTTRLLLMTILGTCHLSDGLTIRNASRLKLNVQLLVVLKTPLQCTEVELTLSAYNSLTQFLALLNEPCRVFLMHTQKRSHKFFCIGGILCLDCT